jgi:alpha-soluble NSF attachment protein
MSVHQAVEFRAMAEKKLKKGGGFMSIFTGGARVDEAQELYQKAANQFKLAHEWNDAADCYLQYAFCSAKLGINSEEATGYVEAANCLRKVSPESSLEWYEKAIEMFSSAGRYQQAAKQLKNVAEMLEHDVKLEESAQYYQKAAEMFEMDEHSKSAISQCNVKLAEIRTRMGKYQEAAKIFEKEGEKALSNHLLQFGAREHFLKAGILYLASGDSVTATIACDRYHQMDPRMEGTRESQLLKGLTAAFVENDVDGFMAAVQEYDSISRLDPWKTELLVAAKKVLQGSSGGHVEAGEVDLT